MLLLSIVLCLIACVKMAYFVVFLSFLFVIPTVHVRTERKLFTKCTTVKAAGRNPRNAAEEATVGLVLIKLFWKTGTANYTKYKVSNTKPTPL